jgi:hypothetical protein
MFCPAAEAAAVAEWMRAAREKADLDGLGYVVVADGQAPSLGGVTCLRGSAPGTASTYLLTPDGRVTLECLGIPPAAALRALEEGRLES